MTLQRISRAALCASLVLVLHAIDVHAQSGSAVQNGATKSYPVVRRETYNRVLDIVFPRDDPDPSKTVFAFVLRYIPNTQPESQVVIRRGVDKIEVVEYTSLDGAIYAKLNDLLARGSKEDAGELARAIRVKKRVVSVPLARVRQWYANFFESLASTTKMMREKGEEFDKTGGSETIFLHGSTYDLWYEQRLNEMSFSLYDIDVDDTRSSAEFKLVQWMIAVRRDVEKMRQ